METEAAFWHFHGCLLLLSSSSSSMIMVVFSSFTGLLKYSGQLHFWLQWFTCFVRASRENAARAIRVGFFLCTAAAFKQERKNDSCIIVHRGPANATGCDTFGHFSLAEYSGFVLSYLIYGEYGLGSVVSWPNIIELGLVVVCDSFIHCSSNCAPT